MNHILPISQFNESSKNDYYQQITRSESSREDLKTTSESFTSEENGKLIELIAPKIKKNPTLSEVSLFYCDNENQIFEYDFLSRAHSFFGFVERTLNSKLSIIDRETSLIEITKKQLLYEMIIQKKEDEWFLVTIYQRKWSEQQSRLGSFQLPDKLEKFYYKCDQLEGLIELIKDYLS